MSVLNTTSKVPIRSFICGVSITRLEVGSPELLKASAYGNDEDIKIMLDYFDQSTKPVFKDEKDSSYIKFGSMSCNDPSAKIRRGTLTLSG